MRGVYWLQPDGVKKAMFILFKVKAHVKSTCYQVMYSFLQARAHTPARYKSSLMERETFHLMRIFLKT